MKKAKKQGKTKTDIQKIIKTLPDEVKIAINVMNQAKMAQKITPSQEIEHAPINFSS